MVVWLLFGVVCRVVGFVFDFVVCLLFVVCYVVFCIAVCSDCVCG